MDMFQNSLFLWGMLFVVAISISIVVLTEILERLQNKQHPLTAIIALIRNVVLPLLALLVLLRTVAELNETTLFVRLIATFFWLILTFVILRLSAAFLSKKNDMPSWQDKVPLLIKRLPALTLASLIIVHLIQNVWQLPLSELATTLGLGSVVIAFALQDTLSNLVSGLLLLINRPFIEGEWVQIGDTLGRVEEINWRYTYIETLTGNMVIVPNGKVAQDSLLNYSRPDRLICVDQAIDVAFANPPNKVKQMLMETMSQTPGILAEPAPMAFVMRIDDPMMGYEVRYWISDYRDKRKVHDAFMTRVWYAAQRHEVPFPRPAYDLFYYNGSTVNQEAEITPQILSNKLREIQLFTSLPENAVATLAERTQFLRYAHDEEIIAAHEHEKGLFVLLKGTVAMSIPNLAGVNHIARHLHAGEFFGETGLFGRAISPFTIVAEEDIELLLISHTALAHLINQYPLFAAEFNIVVSKRRLLAKQMTNVNAPSLSVPSLSAPSINISEQEGHTDPIQKESHR